MHISQNNQMYRQANNASILDNCNQANDRYTGRVLVQKLLKTFLGGNKS